MLVRYFFTAEDLKTGLDEDSVQIADIISDYVLNYRIVRESSVSLDRSNRVRL